MKSFSGGDLQAFEVNAVAAIELEVAPGKILANDANQFDRSEETGGNRCVARRAAEQPRVFAPGSLDRVQGGGTNHENAHNR